MIKYYCDICEKELKTSDEHFVYILPQRVPYYTKAFYEQTAYTQIVCTYEQIEDKNLAVCPSCRKKISYALKEIKDEMAKKKS